MGEKAAGMAGGTGVFVPGGGGGRGERDGDTAAAAAAFVSLNSDRTGVPAVAGSAAGCCVAGDASLALAGA